MGREKAIDLLTVDEMFRILNNAGRGIAGARNRAMIAILWRSGLRSKEVCDLIVKDVDIVTSTILVRRGKGGKQRIVGMDEETAKMVYNWVRERVGWANRIKDQKNHLFLTSQGHPCSPSYLRSMLLRIRNKIGLKKRLHPHAFRHSHAVELRREGVPIEVISKQLGHSSSYTTAIYLDHLHPEEVVRVIRDRAWVTE